MPSGKECKQYVSSLSFCIEWSATANIQGGYSDVWVKMAMDSWEMYSPSQPGYIIVDGNREDFNFAFSVSGKSYTTIHERWLRVNHNSDGCKPCTIECSYRWFGYYSGVYIDYFNHTLNVNFDCIDPIDQSTPTIQLSVTNIQTDRFRIEGKSLYDNCDDWQYQINNGAWTKFPNTNGWSSSTDITGLQENTEYTVEVWGQKASNHVGGYSGKQTIRTQKEQSPPTITFEITNIQPTSFTINAQSNVNSKSWEYQLNDGSWTSFGQEGTSSSVTVSSLTENTNYKVIVRATKVYNGIVGTSSSKNVRTQKEQSPPTITFEVTNIQPTSFTINAQSNVECEDWKYSINSGEWISFDGSSTTASISLSNLDDYTQYNIQVKARKIYNQIEGVSEVFTVQTPKEQSPPIIKLNITDIQQTTITIYAESEDVCEEWIYILNGKSFPLTQSGTSINVTITDVKADTEYKIQVRAKKSYNDVIGTSDEQTIKTQKKQIPKITFTPHQFISKLKYLKHRETMAIF